MFKGFINKGKKKEPIAPKEINLSERRKEDKSPSEALSQMIMSGLQDNKGVHIETVLTTLAALTGFSTQMAVREKLIKTNQMSEKDAFQIVETNNGEIYYGGNIMNDPLIRVAEGHSSLFSFVAGTAQAMGATKFPDINNIFQHTESTYGNEKFGVPRLPQGHMPKYTPEELLKDSWKVVSAYLLVHDESDPLMWPFLLSNATAHFSTIVRGAIDPDLIAFIVMESAIPMSRINPDKIIGQENPVGERVINLEKTDMGKLYASEEFVKALTLAKANEEKGQSSAN